MPRLSVANVHVLVIEPVGLVRLLCINVEQSIHVSVGPVSRPVDQRLSSKADSSDMPCASQYVLYTRIFLSASLEASFPFASSSEAI